MDLESIKRRFEDFHIRRVKLGAFDIDGILRGKYISLEKFWLAVESGLGFCDVIFGWDIGDVLYDNVKFTGWHTGYPDAHCRIDLASYRLVPWEPGTAFFLLDFCRPDGQPLAIAPRQVLERVLARAAERGYSASFAAEYEFFIFRETAQSLRDKHFAGLTALSPGMFGYSVLAVRLCQRGSGARDSGRAGGFRCAARRFPYRRRGRAYMKRPSPWRLIP